jgi:hypothetical protein
MRALPLGALRCVVVVLLCLLGRAPHGPPPLWLDGPSGPSSRADNTIGVALAHAPSPSLDRGTSKVAKASARDLADQGGVGPCLLPPGLPLLAGPAEGAALAARSVASSPARPSLPRPVARAPPTPSRLV